jgi:hypothetical protein
MQTNNGAQLVVGIIISWPYRHHLAQSKSSRVYQDAATGVDHGQVVSHVAPGDMGNMMVLRNGRP